MRRAERNSFRIPNLLRGISPAGPRNQMVIGPDPARGEISSAGTQPPKFALPPLNLRWWAATWSRVPRVDSRGGNHHCYHHGSANVWRSHWIIGHPHEPQTIAPATSSTLAPRLAAHNRAFCGARYTGISLLESHSTSQGVPADFRLAGPPRTTDLPWRPKDRKRIESLIRGHPDADERWHAAEKIAYPN